MRRLQRRQAPLCWEQTPTPSCCSHSGRTKPPLGRSQMGALFAIRRVIRRENCANLSDQGTVVAFFFAILAQTWEVLVCRSLPVSSTAQMASPGATANTDSLTEAIGLSKKDENWKGKHM